MQCLWNVLKHQDTITLAPLLLPRPRVARCPIDFLQNQMCRYQRSVMFTCLLGSSAFIAIQNDPNLLYNTVFFYLCVCFVWPWIQFDWNGRSQWMQSFWELTTQIWVWFILGAGHKPFWIVTNLWQYFSTVLNCVWQYRKMSFSLSIMFFPGAQVGPPALMCSKLRHKTLLSALICFRWCQLCLVLPCFRWMVFSIPSDLLADKSKF